MTGVLALGDKVSPRTLPESFAAAGFVLASSIIFLLNTRYGIGILPDSVAYMQIGSAKHFAPAYTWILQAVAALGFDIVAGAKWIGLALVAINTFLIWKLLFLPTRSLGAAAAGTALIVFSPIFVKMHAVAMTEPLLLLFLFCSLLLFVRGLDDQRRYWFPLVGAVIGFAMLARFAAAPILAALCVCRLLYANRPLGQRLLDCVLMGAAAILIFGSWMIASELTAGESTGRAFAFYGRPTAALWWSGLNSLSIMLLPSPAPTVLRFILLAVAVGAMIWAALAYGRRWFQAAAAKQPLRWATVPVVCGLFILTYAGFIILTVYIQASLPLNGRILLPFYVATVIVATVVVARQSIVTLPPAMRVGAVALVILVLLSHGARTTVATTRAFADGIGYADRAWSISPVLRAVDSLPEQALIFSNAPDVISFRLGRDAEYLPRRVNHLTLVEDPDNPFRAQMDALRESMEQGKGYVVFLDRVGWRFYLASEQQLVSELSLVKVADAEDGRIYRSPTAD